MIRVFLILIIAGILQAAPARQALWVYPDQGTGANTMTDPAARQTLVASASASDVTDLYVSVYQSTANSAGRLMYPDSDMADLIQRAHALRMRVWASYGNPDWPTDGCAATGAPLKDMAMVVAYNAANPTAHFDGVVLDIEPPEPQTTAQYQALLAIYQCIQASLPQRAHERLELAVTMQFSWTQAVAYGGSTKPVYEHIIDMDLANVIVMGYRNTAGTGCSGSEVNGIICLDEPMVDYAKNGVVLAGVDTNNCVPGLMQMFGVGFFSQMVFEKADWNYRDANVAEIVKAADEKLAKTLNATDPNLSAFKARGGKLILYHGWNDPAISAVNTINYYQSVVGAMGQDAFDSFARVYMVPGMQHCDGGVGPDSFGENGPWPNVTDPHQSLQVSIEQWVEKGAAPKEIIATKFSGPMNSGKAEMTRPLCVYPKVAIYESTGDVNSAASFVCANDK